MDLILDNNSTPRLTHQMAFVAEALASLFHNSPGEYLKLLKRDGTKLLRFYWDEVGKNTAGAVRADAFGLNYEIRTPSSYETHVLITLPRPLIAGEAYFALQVYSPLRHTPFLGISDITRMYTLEMDPAQESGTRLREFTRRFRQEDLGPGPVPQLEDFYAAVMQIIQEEK
jgi:hypothetical protein